MVEFEAFPKIPRLYKEVVITEKIDGTNAQAHVLDDGTVLAASRKRYITPENDNFGFAAWVKKNEDELRGGLGPGRHYGEWWGQGIQRGYGLNHRRFSLFNTSRWTSENTPECCLVVPELYRGEYWPSVLDELWASLRDGGSVAATGFARPEGMMLYHTAANQLFKMPFDK